MRCGLLELLPSKGASFVYEDWAVVKLLDLSTITARKTRIGHYRAFNQTYSVAWV